MTSFLAHSIWLAAVLGHALVNLLDDIESDRATEDGGKRVGLVAGLAIGA